MNHHEIRARLAEVIEGIDSGRWSLPAPATRMRRVGAPLLAAALGLGVAGCPNKGPEPPPQADTPTSSTGPGVVAPAPAYAVPAPDQGAPTDPGPVPEYMAPDPGPMAEYMAPDPGPRPDTGVVALYAAPDVPSPAPKQ